MSESTGAIPTKSGKLTANKARERIAGLEESISVRQHRLDQLNLRLERSDSKDERLLVAKGRLERRIQLEREQLSKLTKLLRRSSEPIESSGEFAISEEFDDLHRSFEEMRQGLAQVQVRIDSIELPRELGARLSSFEDRVSRREEVDSELYSNILATQATVDQERQLLRRLQRRIREHDQNLEALREAVEDSVVTTVDLAQRLEELEDSFSDYAAQQEASSLSRLPLQEVDNRIKALQEDLLSLKAHLYNAMEGASADNRRLAEEQKNLRQVLSELTLDKQKENPASQNSGQLQALSKRLSRMEAWLEQHSPSDAPPTDSGHPNLKKAEFSTAKPSTNRRAEFTTSSMRGKQ